MVHFMLHLFYHNFLKRMILVTKKKKKINWAIFINSHKGIHILPPRLPLLELYLKKLFKWKKNLHVSDAHSQVRKKNKRVHQ